jgi:hypothetical protein
VHVWQAKVGAFLLGNIYLHIQDWSCNGRKNFGIIFSKPSFRREGIFVD